MSSRPDRDQWHLRGAEWLAEMGDCTRRTVGALIVGPDKRFWGMGYNGSYPGGPSCLEGDCPRGRHYDTGEYTEVGECGSRWHGVRAFVPSRAICPDCQPLTRCACGNAWPCPDAVEPGSSYDTGPGACIASHAEANAVADAMQRNGGTLDGCVMYVSCEPCDGCTRHVRNTTRISAIIWPDGAIGLP